MTKMDYFAFAVGEPNGNVHNPHDCLFFFKHDNYNMYDVPCFGSYDVGGYICEKWMTLDTLFKFWYCLFCFALFGVVFKCLHFHVCFELVLWFLLLLCYKLNVLLDYLQKKPLWSIVIPNIYCFVWIKHFIDLYTQGSTLVKPFVIYWFHSLSNSEHACRFVLCCVFSFSFTSLKWGKNQQVKFENHI